MSRFALALTFLLLLRAAPVHSQSAQLVHCVYGFFDGKYYCYMPRVNITTRAHPLRIEGEHLSGKSSADVRMIQASSMAKDEVTVELLHPQIFEEFPNLDEITVEDARLASMEIAKCAKIEKLVLMFCKRLTEVPSGVFGSCQSLKHLDLSRGGIKVVHSDSFSGLRSLEHLDLIANPMVEIFNKSLVDSPNLRELHVGLNGSVEVGALATLQSLEILKISINNSKFEFFERLIGDLANLKSIDLSENFFSFANLKFFARFAHLEKLFLHHNSLTEIPENSFENSSLSYLSLGYNRIGGLNQSTFEGLARLQILWLNDNLIGDLSSLPFRHLTALQELYLQNNPLSVLPTNLLKDKRDLEVLSLAGCKISVIEPEALFGLAKLRRLDLENNRLTALPDETFTHLPNLGSLNLAGNRIRQLSTDSFRNVMRLTYLDVKDNRLEEIETFFFENFQNIHIFGGGGNVCVNETIYNVRLIEFWKKNALSECFENWQRKQPTTTTTESGGAVRTASEGGTAKNNGRLKIGIKIMIFSLIFVLAVLKIFIIVYIKCCNKGG